MPCKSLKDWGEEAVHGGHWSFALNVRRLPELTFVLGIVGKFQETSRLKSFSLVQSDILDDQSNTTYMNTNFEETSYPFFGATQATRARVSCRSLSQDFLCPLQFCREQSTFYITLASSQSQPQYPTGTYVESPQNQEFASKLLKVVF